MKRLLLNLKRRPVILLISTVLVGLTCFWLQFNGFTRKFGSLSALFRSDYVGTLTEIADWFRNKATQPSLMVVSVIIALAALFAVSAILGLISSGFSYVLYVNSYSTLHRQNRRPKSSGVLFIEGINKRFWSMTGFLFLSLLLSFLLTFAIAYMTMPMALSIEKVVSGETGQIFSMILLSAITILVLFFGIVFFAMYVSFTFPSIIAFRKGALKVSIKMVNAYCWYLIPRTFAYLLYLAAVDFLLLAVGFGFPSTGLALLVFAGNVLLKLAGFLVYSDYVFGTYVEMKDDMFNEG